jgi:hypothetical protein
MGTKNSSDRMAATLYCLGTLFVSGMCINTLHKGDSDDDNNNNNNNFLSVCFSLLFSPVKDFRATDIYNQKNIILQHACSARFSVAGKLRKVGMHAGNTQCNTGNEECVSIRTIMRIILLACVPLYHVQ